MGRGETILRIWRSGVNGAAGTEGVGFELLGDAKRGGSIRGRFSFSEFRNDGCSSSRMETSLSGIRTGSRDGEGPLLPTGV